MTCIVCGSESDILCTIKGMTVCLCARHLGNRKRYDVVAVPEEEQPWPARLPPGDHFPPYSCHTHIF